VDPTAELRFRIDKGIRRYVAQRKELLNGFLADRFYFRGTFEVFFKTLKTDVIRHPLNFVLSIPLLFIGKIAGWLEKFGLSKPAQVVQKVPLRFGTNFERKREEQLCSGLLGLSRDDRNALVIALSEDAVVKDALDRFPGLLSFFRTREVRNVVASPIRELMASRASILDLASTGLTLLVAYLLFGKVALSPYDMGRRLADSSARDHAASRFVLGRGLGRAFYSIFPTHPTTMQIVLWSAAVIFSLGALTAVIGVLSDPVQQYLGVHRRQLNRLLDACEDRLVLHAAKNLNELEMRSTPPKPLLQSPEPAYRVQAPPAPRQGFSTISATLSSFLRKVVYMPKQGIRAFVDAAVRLEARFGRQRIFLALAALLIAVGLVGFWIYRRMDPYFEVRGLIDQKAFVTAVARLDQIGKKASRTKDAEYWYWRGRALTGNKSLDAGIEAYRSAVSKAPNYRRDPIVIQDAIEAVASKDHEKAKQFILQEIGPDAIGPLLARAVAPEDVHRWSLVELVKKLGGEGRIRYEPIVLADLTASPSCPAKRKAIDKVTQYRVKAAIPALRDLDSQPQMKCLQGAVKPAIAKLESPQ
jgi:hypothetical protein